MGYWRTGGGLDDSGPVGCVVIEAPPLESAAIWGMWIGTMPRPSYVSSVLGDEVISEPISEGRNRQRRVWANRTRHHRAVGDVEIRIVKDLAIRVNHAFLLTQGHRAAAERVSREHLGKVPGVGRGIHVFGMQRPGNRLAHCSHAVEILP